MNSLSDGLEHFLVPDDQVVEAAVTRGLVVLDANVLLEGYRYHPETREDLFDVLERLGDRLWIPHQVAAEFLANRLNVMAGLDTAYHDVVEAVRAHRRATVDALDPKIRQ